MAPTLAYAATYLRGKEVNANTLVIQKGRRFYQVPVSSISTFDVSIKRYRNIGKGLIIGLAAGAVMTILINIPDPETDLQGLGQAYATLIVLPSIAVISTLIGAITKSDKWVEVSPKRLNLSLEPTSPKGLRAALTFNF